jgi:hypothetical protein
MTPLKQFLLIAAYVTHLIFGEGRGEGERRMMTKPAAWLFCT